MLPRSRCTDEVYAAVHVLYEYQAAQFRYKPETAVDHVSAVNISVVRHASGHRLDGNRPRYRVYPVQAGRAALPEPEAVGEFVIHQRTTADGACQGPEEAHRRKHQATA